MKKSYDKIDSDQLKKNYDKVDSVDSVNEYGGELEKKNEYDKIDQTE